MADLELLNESDRVFTDISSEAIRVYLLPNGGQVEINEPQWLSVSPSGNHYIVNREGVAFVIAPGWTVISWRSKPGAPHFVA